MAVPLVWILPLNFRLLLPTYLHLLVMLTAFFPSTFPFMTMQSPMLIPGFVSMLTFRCALMFPVDGDGCYRKLIRSSTLILRSRPA